MTQAKKLRRLCDEYEPVSVELLCECYCYVWGELPSLTMAGKVLEKWRASRSLPASHDGGEVMLSHAAAMLDRIGLAAIEADYGSIYDWAREDQGLSHRDALAFEALAHSDAHKLHPVRDQDA